MCTIRVTAAVLVVNGNRRMDNVVFDYISILAHTNQDFQRMALQILGIQEKKSELVEKENCKFIS